MREINLSWWPIAPNGWKQAMAGPRSKGFLPALSHGCSGQAPGAPSGVFPGTLPGNWAGRGVARTLTIAYVEVGAADSALHAVPKQRLPKM